MKTKPKTIGELPTEEWLRVMGGDPHENPDYEGRMERAQQTWFSYHQDDGLTPEQAYPDDPVERAAYRKFLKDHPTEDEAKRETGP